MSAHSEARGWQQHRLLLLRHGETEWSLTGRHTGRTELELTETGRVQAKLAADALDVLSLDKPLVVSSPRQRALVTAELAGLAVDEVSPVLAEWDYGDYEGLTTKEIQQSVPDWLVWTHGCPGGESTQQVSDRADRAIEFALEQMRSRDVLFVGHGHFSRAVLTRWVQLEISEGIRFAMVAASIAVCGYEHGVRQIIALGLTGHRHPCLPS
ncbi:acid phosphatase [Mycolicibacterium gadium]|uniref:Acid phosphatase n=1 Tax=Mycolicibacterium gadium TaxID=1794 RepID=A0ABT6GKB0_MYCGU|nr:acid phosphatase [Mycolicibacterium gadium]MDG5481809.1 acid phosphatase [Mycolicibacterium gadium]